MSERPTPRTDSAIMEIPSKFGSICVVRVELALDLERELGDALQERDELREDLKITQEAWVKAKAERVEALRERDEARSLTEHQWLLKVGSRLVQAGCKSDGITESLDEIIRERDEARAERDILRSNKMSDPLLETTFKHLIRERDEAREAFVIATDQMVIAQGKVREANKERDEAREALMKIEDLFIDGTDIYADREKMGTIAKEALDGAK